MTFVESVYYISSEQTLNPFKSILEKTEFESFCCVIPLQKKEAWVALQNLKVFLNTKEFLSFETLNGGDCNAPILIFKITDFQKTPIAVLKHS